MIGHVLVLFLSTSFTACTRDVRAWICEPENERIAAQELVSRMKLRMFSAS